MQIDPNWLSAISNLIVALSAVFVGWQVRVSIRTLEELKRQRTDDHERSRRENAVQLLQEWIGHNTNSEPSARFIVERFSPEECQKLLNMQPFYIPTERAGTLKNALFDSPKVQFPQIDEAKGIYLNADVLFELGRLCHSYLSALEVICIAWRNGTADKAILEQQLTFIVKPERNYYCARNFREAMGGTNTYPNIQAFVDQVLQSKTATPPSRDPL